MEQLTLFLISQFAGLVMIVSGVLLIYRQKIYLNPATNDVMEVDIPVFGKIKTNIPAIALFIVGFIPLIYPVYKWQSPLQSLTVVQPLVKSNLHPVKVYVVVRTDVVEQDRQLKLAVPLLPTQEYDMKLLYLAGTIVADESLDLKLAKAGELVLQSREIQVPTVEAAKSQALQADIQPKPVIFK